MYDSPHQFEPLLPGAHLLPPLLSRAAKIVNNAAQLSGIAHPTTRDSLRDLLRRINSYYSNRIEGQGTTPRDIDAALRNDFSREPATARLQRIARAHIEAEEDLERHDHPLHADFAIEAHRALYERLQPDDLITKDKHVLAPESVRQLDVQVGNHVPPSWESLPRFMQAFTKQYLPTRSLDMQLIVIACAHQRMTWMQPFADGNGRATRLQTHVAMLPITHGLWSVNRGLARNTADYYSHLAAADANRQGDLDGRGNLSERGLVKWIEYFLSVCEDQLAYMTQMLDLDTMKAKIAGLVQVEISTRKRFRDEAVLPLYHLFAAGPATRGEFIQMTGLGERTGRTLLSQLVESGLVESSSTRAPVKFAFPIFAQAILFPDLYGQAL